MVNTIETTELEGNLNSMQIAELSEGIYKVNSKTGSDIIEVLSIDLNLKTLKIRHKHSTYEFAFKNNLDLVLDKMGIKRSVDKISTDIKAPMPGKVIEILVKEGDAVSKGDGILILEAMKMENVLKAEHDCIIKKVIAVKANSVEKNEVLVELKSE